MASDVGQFALAVVHLVDALHVGHREVQVESASALVAPGLSEERRVLTGLRDNVLDRGLEEEGAVGRVERVAVPQVDLVLARAEFVISGEDADVHLVEHAHEVEENAVRVNQGSGCVHTTRARERAFVASVIFNVRDVELEFGADDRLESDGVVFVDDFFKDGAWRDHVRRVVGVEGIGYDVRDTRFEGERGDGVGFDRTDEVLQSVRRDVYGIKDVATRRRDPGALTERRAVVGCLVELADEHVFRPRNTEYVSKDEPQDVNPLVL